MHPDLKEKYKSMLRFRLPWNRQERPLVIQTNLGKIHAGVGFTLSHEGRYIDFFEDPQVLFPQGHIHVEQAEAPANTIAHKLWDFYPMEGPIDYVIESLCTDPSEWQLKKALSVFAGAHCLERDSFITDAIPFQNGYIYRGPDVELFVDYPHKPLLTNKLHPEGTVVGKMVSIWPYDEHADEQWWGHQDEKQRKENFTDYLQLINFFPIQGRVVLPNKMVPVYAIHSDIPGDRGTTHIRFQVYEDRVTDDRFWSYVWANETRTGNFLNTLVNLPAPPEPSGVMGEVPQCWDDVVREHTQSRYFEHLYSIPKTHPDLDALPENLKTLVNPIAILMAAGYKEVLQMIRMRYTDVHKNILNLGRYLRLSKPTDRIRITELERDSLELAEHSLTSQSSFAVLTSVDLTRDLPNYNWTYDSSGNLNPIAAEDLPAELAYYFISPDDFTEIIPVTNGSTINPTYEHVWRLEAGELTPQSTRFVLYDIPTGVDINSSTQLVTVSDFDIEQL
jgi:hypothetical protein